MEGAPNEKDSQRRFEAVKSLNSVLEKEMQLKLEELNRHTKISTKQHDMNRKQMEEELRRIQGESASNKSMSAATSTQRLNYHRETILGHRDRTVHYNRRQCSQARAILPKVWRKTLPDKNKIFAKLDMEHEEHEQALQVNALPSADEDLQQRTVFREKNILSREKNTLSREKNTLSREKNTLSREKDGAQNRQSLGDILDGVRCFNSLDATPRLAKPKVHFTLDNK